MTSCEGCPYYVPDDPDDRYCHGPAGPPPPDDANCAEDYYEMRAEMAAEDKYMENSSYTEGVG